MKSFVRSVPAILFMSVAALSLTGCGSSGGGSGSGPAAAKNIYALQHSGDPGLSETEQDSVLVFSASATGSTTPTSILALPSGFVSITLAVGPTGTIYVGGIPNNLEAGNDLLGQILEYPAGSGSATPTVTLNGSDEGTTFYFPTSLAVNSAGTLVVSSSDGTLETFASGFTASSAPTQYLTWGQGLGNFVGGGGNDIGVDTAGDIFYMDGGNSVIDVFAAGATGATAPVRKITGTDITSFAGLEYMAVDGAGDVYVTNYNQSDDPATNSAETNPIHAANKSLQAL
jgi:hypothetical protein